MKFTPIPPEKFIHNPKVQAAMDDLGTAFGPGGERLVISDVLDRDGHQYVNLVQEGGGVLGIALLGYTYALEKMGVRFLKLAGTSAGAINTMLLACVRPDEGKTKSEKVLEYLAGKNLFEFVDAFWLARQLIQLLVTNTQFSKYLSFAGLGLLVLMLGGFLVGSIQMHFGHPDAPVLLWTGVGILGLWVLIGLLVMYLYRRFKRSGFGVANGDNFREWLADILRRPENGHVVTLQDFEDRVIAPMKNLGLHLRPEYTHLYPEADTDLNDLENPKIDWITVITSDITTRMKIELPRMWDLYRTEKKDLEVADFVRASMSIPVFFSIHRITSIPVDQVRHCWKQNLNYPPDAPIPSEVNFVDGGILSNFPINIFFNPNVTVPRMPTLGVLLEDDRPRPVQRFSRLGQYLGGVFNTIRFYYDKDFQVKHNDFLKTTQSIDVKKFNWLNFNLEENEKIQLFQKGVEAARDFLLKERDEAWEETPEYVIRQKGFNWRHYQRERLGVLKALRQVPKPPVSA